MNDKDGSSSFDDDGWQDTGIGPGDQEVFYHGKDRYFVNDASITGAPSESNGYFDDLAPFRMRSVVSTPFEIDRGHYDLACSVTCTIGLLSDGSFDALMRQAKNPRDGGRSEEIGVRELKRQKWTVQHMFAKSPLIIPRSPRDIYNVALKGLTSIGNRSETEKGSGGALALIEVYNAVLCVSEGHDRSPLLLATANAAPKYLVDRVVRKKIEYDFFDINRIPGIPYTGTVVRNYLAYKCLIKERWFTGARS